MTQPDPPSKLRLVHPERRRCLSRADIATPPTGPAPPAEGRVEIAYFTLPGHEGRGFGRATAALLVDLARRADPALVVWAKTEPNENASTAILRSLGFRHTGSTTDHEIGEAWQWECPVSNCN